MIVASVAGLGYLVGIFGGAVAWSLFGTSPISGQTNGSDSGGYLWGSVGGVIGAAAALLTIATLRRHSN